ncbi:carotenoid oxygenase family protein [Pseudonocardia sp. H11422]|uniref:carotenoid oxygenase family protein n=1 Tax=Pseudonocardia sp. H11422 TaxID=2835866 RepID=UPI001BDD51A6|nr:carotenoid oxygenase family protein [Pseudonocardia sp. H11422]
MSAPTTPLRLAGHLAPVADEIDAADLHVTGALPAELTGRYLRNGPNPLPGEPPVHWFAGHGMVHGVRLRGGRAEWYRNRWVRTGALAGRSMVGPDGTFDRTVGTSNTHVLAHAGRILALVESSFPCLMTPELETIGPFDFDGRLTTAMTAHPKCDPVTGELHFFGYGVLPPYLTYHRLSAGGELVQSAEIEVPGPTMAHDFAITAQHAVFLDLPMTFQMDLLGAGMPFGWDEHYGARIGVMRLDRPGAVRWFDVDPCYVFHVGNAHSDAHGRIVVDGARYTPADTRAMWASIGRARTGRAAAAAANGAARLHRWILDPATGAVTEQALNDRPVEFPTVDDDRVGRPSRYRYAVSDSGANAAVVKYDAEHGSAAERALGADVVAGEAMFVPTEAPGRAEDDGWLLTIITRRDGSASQLLVLDATDVGGPPVAAVTLPRGVPSGFHCSWISDTAMGL